jgi:hypothetical protein
VHGHQATAIAILDFTIWEGALGKIAKYQISNFYFQDMAKSSLSKQVKWTWQNTQVNGIP